MIGWTPNPRNRSEALASVLAARLAAGEWRPGEKLPSIPELMARYGVSRSTVREALMRLAGQGLVRIVHGEGTIARGRPTAALLPPVSPEERARLCRTLVARKIVEVGIAGEAARRARPEDVAELEAAVRALAALAATPPKPEAKAAKTEGEAAERERPSESESEGKSAEGEMSEEKDAEGEEKGENGPGLGADFRFHRALAEATHNEALLALFSALAEALEDALVQVHRLLLHRPERLEAVIGDHRAIAAAVGRGDPAAARRAMVRHLGRVERWFGCREAVPRRGPKTEGRAGR
ncbi:MAG: FadR family transcriptional regulator [Hydrogenibacillus schlegelii]|nr:FadR family transcriptional regulator [Hydrogenibacillus schlegelii]